MEYLGGKPLCMNQYYQILSSCRVPGPKQDSVINFSKTKKPPMHITVVHNYQVGAPHRPLCPRNRMLWASLPGARLGPSLRDAKGPWPAQLGRTMQGRPPPPPPGLTPSPQLGPG